MNKVANSLATTTLPFAGTDDAPQHMIECGTRPGGSFAVGYYPALIFKYRLRLGIDLVQTHPAVHHIHPDGDLFDEGGEQGFAAAQNGRASSPASSS